MRHTIAALVVLSSLSSFAADRKLCETAVKHTYEVMYAGPKDQAKLKNPKVQEKMAREIDDCAASMSTEKAQCLSKVKAYADLDACSKVK